MLALLIVWFGVPALPDEEGGCLLGCLAVVFLDHVGVGLQEEANIRMAGGR